MRCDPRSAEVGEFRDAVIRRDGGALASHPTKEMDKDRHAQGKDVYTHMAIPRPLFLIF